MGDLFSLGGRLLSCAELVRENVRVADIGTDHAKLPIWLIRSGKAPSAIVSDLREKPLESARINAEKYGVSDRIDVRLSDGLQGYSPNEAEDIIIAGMGGELMLRIIAETPWLFNASYHIILQPMSMMAELRTGLAELGFEVLREKTSMENSKVYSSFSMVYSSEKLEYDEFFPYMGKINPADEHAADYAKKVIRKLEKSMKAFGETDEEYIETDKIIRDIEEKYLGGKHGNG